MSISCCFYIRRQVCRLVAASIYTGKYVNYLLLLYTQASMSISCCFSIHRQVRQLVAASIYAGKYVN